MVLSNVEMKMDVEDWRGYSAYEIAVQEGFSGTKAEWLASLKGEKGDDGDAVTVNGQSASNGNIVIRAGNIQIAAGSAKTVQDVVEPIGDHVTITENLGVTTFDIGGAYIANALFA